MGGEGLFTFLWLLLLVVGVLSRLAVNLIQNTSLPNLHNNDPLLVMCWH